MKSEDEISSLYIPSNIRKRFEYVDGIGKHELGMIAISTAIGLVVGILIFVVQRQLFGLLIPPAAGFLFSYVFARKDRYNQSTIDKIRLLKKFQGGQKRYYYKWRNIYEKDVKNGKEKAKRRSGSEDGK